MPAVPGRGDTIVAIATPMGRGALAVVRVSGPDAISIARRLIQPWPTEHRRLTLAAVRDPQDGRLIDRVLAASFPAPRSYTGEDMVEISGHGGALSPAAISALFVRCGARGAEPGEFTRRAVLNGKIDLLQAEAIGGVVDAKTEAARQAALYHLDGGLTRQIDALRDRLLDLEALLAYDIDFPDEDDGPIPAARVEQSALALLADIGAMLGTVAIGEAIREGAVVVIAGRPNVGKSSLLNALVGFRRAIVSPEPGTTRDAIEVMIEGPRWPLRFVDTAGLRDAADVVEREGVEVSRRYLRGAHLILLCEDDPSRLEASRASVRELTDAPVLAVATKSDLRPGEPEAGPDVVRVSAVTRDGLPALLRSVEEALDRSLGSPQADLPILLRERHRAALEAAAAEVKLFVEAWRERSVPAAVAAVHVRTAAHALEALAGVIDAEDVLARVFAGFCIGK